MSNWFAKKGQGTMRTLELSSRAMARAIVPASEKLLCASSSFVSVACVCYFEVFSVFNDNISYMEWKLDEYHSARRCTVPYPNGRCGCGAVVR